MRSAFRAGLVALASVWLAACGERAQGVKPAAKKSDTQAWQASESAHSAPGFKSGDKTAWEEQLRQRAQAQNDYAR